MTESPALCPALPAFLQTLHTVSMEEEGQRVRPRQGSQCSPAFTVIWLTEHLSCLSSVSSSAKWENSYLPPEVAVRSL